MPTAILYDILEYAIRLDASDVLIKAGTRPAVRVDGRIRATDLAPLTPEETETIAHEIVYTSSRDRLLRFSNPEQLEQAAGQLNAQDLLDRIHTQEELDLVFTIPGTARIRANVYMQQATIAAALRIIPLQPRTLEELNLPPVLKDMALKPQGLIVITGPTGSGKSTTLAGLIETINRNRAANVVTIEDPIEYVFQDKHSMIQQREVGQDTRSFNKALRSVLRQSPDVIMVGEMRDAETMEVALTAAEVGHLVLTTLHTSGAPQTVERLLNSFAGEKRLQIAAQIASGLLCIASQRLIPRAEGRGRIPAVEVMTGSPTVKRLIEAGELTELPQVIRDGAHFGMQSFNMSLAELANRNAVTTEVALSASPDQAELKQMLRQ